MPDFVTDQRHIVTLANGDRVPALGQGTWYPGDSRATHDREALALRGRLFESPALAEVACRHGATVPQVVLAWDVRGGDTIAIPRSSRPEHTLENAAADAIELTEEDLALISRDFPAPSHKMPLDME